MIGFVFAVVLSVVVAFDTPVFATEVDVLETETVLEGTEIDEEISPDGVLSDAEIVDVPMVVTPDLSGLSDTLDSIDNKLDVVVTALDTSIDSYQVSEYYQNYFRGVLQNMSYTEYLCYAQRVYDGSSSYSNYTTHYYLLYDLDIDDGKVVAGTYPCIDVYAQNNVYVAQETTKVFNGYPTIGFASFAPYSALIDRSFDYRGLFVGLISVLFMFVLCRKTVFS